MSGAGEEDRRQWLVAPSIVC